MATWSLAEQRDDHPAFFEFADAFGLPKIALMAGPSTPLGTIHRQPQERHRK
jgi:hypothetical protein